MKVTIIEKQVEEVVKDTQHLIGSEKTVKVRHGKCLRNTVWASIWSRANQHARNIHAKILAYPLWCLPHALTSLYICHSNSHAPRSGTRHSRACGDVHLAVSPSDVFACHKFPDPEVLASTKQCRSYGLHWLCGLDRPCRDALAVGSLSICMNVNGWEGMLFIGINAAIGVRVSNELGSGHPRAAKYSVFVIVAQSLCIGILLMCTVMLTKNQFAVIFTESKEMQRAVAHLAYLLAITMVLNSVQPVISGVAVGGGWQALERLKLHNGDFKDVVDAWPALLYGLV